MSFLHMYNYGSNIRFLLRVWCTHKQQNLNSNVHTSHKRPLPCIEHYVYWMKYRIPRKVFSFNELHDLYMARTFLLLNSTLLIQYALLFLTDFGKALTSLATI